MRSQKYLIITVFSFAFLLVLVRAALAAAAVPQAGAKPSKQVSYYRAFKDRTFKIFAFFRLDKIRIRKAPWMVPYGRGPWVYGTLWAHRPWPLDPPGGSPLLPGFNPAKAVYLKPDQLCHFTLRIRGVLIPRGHPLPAKVPMHNDLASGIGAGGGGLNENWYSAARDIYQSSARRGQTVVTSLYKPTKPDRNHPHGVYACYSGFPVYTIPQPYRKVFLPAWKFYRAHLQWFAPKFAGKYSRQLLTLVGGKNFYLAQEACAVMLDATPTPLTHGEVFRLLPKMRPHLQAYFIYEIFNFDQPTLLAGVSRYVKNATSIKALLPVALACAYAYRWHPVSSKVEHLEIGVSSVRGTPAFWKQYRMSRRTCSMAWPLLQQIKKKALHLGGDAKGIAKIDRLMTFAHVWYTNSNRAEERAYKKKHPKAYHKEQIR